MDTCIDWLDVAAVSDRWRIIIPAIFSGMEALLVHETVGLKAEIVTVRSAAMHVALDHGFFDPGEVIAAYRLRSDLIHGAPTSEILEKDATDFAEFRRLWAFRVLCDYLELVRAIARCSSSHVHTSLHFPLSTCETTSRTLVAPSDVVAEYRRIVPTQHRSRALPTLPDRAIHAPTVSTRLVHRSWLTLQIRSDSLNGSGCDGTEGRCDGGELA